MIIDDHNDEDHNDEDHQNYHWISSISLSPISKQLISFYINCSKCLSVFHRSCLHSRGDQLGISDLQTKKRWQFLHSWFERSHIPSKNGILSRWFSELPVWWDMLIPWRVSLKLLPLPLSSTSGVAWFGDFFAQISHLLSYPVPRSFPFVKKISSDSLLTNIFFTKVTRAQYLPFKHSF